ncbi:cytosolic sulfotransferase 15-like [Beta vulgaris subsp. vulgaris]|uniref:cytosolic sulfotransferase 15-like n=1 Tax=Beta vulgaris subsp. vulgaris TaxID=3555 RepID=UPI0020375749|nr:cytosolic sulfotransferase 15-like [Beta vulgaris subsp. vulgaris]
MAPPRLISTHMPYTSLPTSVKESECKVVCMARNPLDTFVSLWKFLTQVYAEFLQQMTMEDYSEIFCNGDEAYGPYWDHVLGYWKESLERPSKVLFLKYEDMKGNGKSEMKRLAEFLGCGFSLEEEKQGVIKEIMKLFSLSHLKELEVNKSERFVPVIENILYFRKGEVGDWANHFSPIMIQRFDQMIKDKIVGSGLEFKI